MEKQERNTETGEDDGITTQVLESTSNHNVTNPDRVGPSNTGDHSPDETRRISTHSNDIGNQMEVDDLCAEEQMEIETDRGSYTRYSRIRSFMAEVDNWMESFSHPPGREPDLSKEPEDSDYDFL